MTSDLGSSRPLLLRIFQLLPTQPVRSLLLQCVREMWDLRGILVSQVLLDQGDHQAHIVIPMLEVRVQFVVEVRGMLQQQGLRTTSCGQELQEQNCEEA